MKYNSLFLSSMLSKVQESIFLDYCHCAFVNVSLLFSLLKNGDSNFYAGSKLLFLFH